MSIADSRELTITLDEQTAEDMKAWGLVMAKSVKSGEGAPVSNIIWRAFQQYPKAAVRWTTKYAIGWTGSVPVDGAVVEVGSNVWTVVELGSVWHLKADGFFENLPSSDIAVPDWITVTSDFATSLTKPHITIALVTGSTDGKDTFETIYVDSDMIPINTKLSYQPQEDVACWFSKDIKAGAIYSKGSSASAHIDFSQFHEWSVAYTSTTGKWINLTHAPAMFFAVMSSGYSSDVEPTINHVITFAVDITKAAIRSLIVHAVKSALEKLGRYSIHFVWTKCTLVVQYLSAPRRLNPSPHLGVSAQDDTEAIREAVNNAEKDKTFGPPIKFKVA